MSELKKCPFCGGSRIKVYPNPNKDLRDLGIEQYKVSCVNCAAQLCRAGKEEAIEAWNRREEDELMDSRNRKTSTR